MWTCCSYDIAPFKLLTQFTLPFTDPPSDSSLKAVHGNTTVLRGSPMTLICSTDANPEANVYVFYFNLGYLGVSNSGVINVTVEEDGIFTCIPNNPVGSGRTSLSVIVVGTLLYRYIYIQI